MPFSEVTGHEGAIRRLRAAIRNGRVAHGYIFSGPEGVGKSLVAEQFARAILCERCRDDACGQCPSCRKVEHGNHPGFERIEPGGKGRVISIDDLRDLRRRLAFGAWGGQHRIVLVDSADRMLPQAANAFLKTLEEPPAGIVLILVTAQPSALLETVVSRCQVVRFAPVASGDIEALLTERHGASAEAARLAAAMSDGSPGRAVRLLDGDLGDRRDELLEDLLGLQPGNAPERAQRFVEAVGKRATAVAEQRKAARGLLSLMLYIYRDILVARLAQEEYPLYNADRREQLSTAASGFSTDGLIETVDAVIEAAGLVDANANLEMLFEHLLGRLAEANRAAAAA